MPTRRTKGTGVGTMKRRSGMIRMGLYLSDIQMKRIKTLSKKKGLTASEIIRRMIDERLEKPKGGN
jgi:predicted DNA-binding protein